VKIAILRSGGVTGRRQASGLAASYSRKVSSHPLHEVSDHLLAATVTQHRLGYVDWATLIRQEPLRIAAGMAIVLDQPGNGMHRDADAVAQFRLN